MLTGSSREALTHKFPKLSIVYVWGYNGYCRLGLGNQKDVLTPQIVPQAGRLLVKLPEDKHSYKNLAVRRAAQAISWCQGGSRSFKLCGNRPAGHVLCGRKGWVLASRFMFDTSPTILSFFQWKNTGDGRYNFILWCATLVPTFPFSAGVDDDMSHTKDRLVSRTRLSDLCKISWGVR